VRLTITLCAVAIIVSAGSLAHAQSMGNTNRPTTGSNTGSGLSSSANASGIQSNATGSATGSGLALPTAMDTTAAQSFIGSNATQNFVGATRQTTNQQGMNRQFGQFQNTQTNTGSTSQTTGTPREVRTSLRVGFSSPRPTDAAQRNAMAPQNLVNLTRYVQQRPDLIGIEVNLNSQGTATLTGSTTSIESSRLASNLIRFQPGVRRVDNQVRVAAN
jgi:hypothetical protein